MDGSQDVFGVMQSIIDLGKWQLGTIVDAIEVFSDYKWLMIIAVILLIVSQHVMNFLERVQNKTRDEAFSFAERVFEKHTSTVGEMVERLNRPSDPALARELATLNTNLNSLSSLLNQHITRLNLGPTMTVSAPPPPPPPLPPPPMPTPRVVLPASTPQTTSAQPATPAQPQLVITTDELQKTLQSLRKTKLTRKTRSPAKKTLFRRSIHDRTKRESLSKKKSPKALQTKEIAKDESKNESFTFLSTPGN